LNASLRLTLAKICDSKA
jgi:hypothetical protein